MGRSAARLACRSLLAHPIKSIGRSFDNATTTITLLHLGAKPWLKISLNDFIEFVLCSDSQCCYAWIRLLLYHGGASDTNKSQAEPEIVTPHRVLLP